MHTLCFSIDKTFDVLSHPVLANDVQASIIEALRSLSEVEYADDCMSGAPKTNGISSIWLAPTHRGQAGGSVRRWDECANLRDSNTLLNSVSGTINTVPSF